MKNYFKIFMLVTLFSLSVIAQEKNPPNKVGQVGKLKNAVDKVKTEVVDKIKKAQETGNTNLLQQKINEFEVPETDPVIEDRYQSY